MSIFTIEDKIFQRKLNYLWQKQAVFGGRISGRQQKGLKVNPIYSDGSTNNSLGSREQSQDLNGNMNSVKVVTYESIPKTDDKVNISKPVKPGEVNNDETDHIQPTVDSETEPVSDSDMLKGTLKNLKKSKLSGNSYDHLTRVKKDLVDKHDEKMETNSDDALDNMSNEPELNKAVDEGLIRQKSKDYHLLGHTNKAFVLNEIASNVENEENEIDKNRFVNDQNNSKTVKNRSENGPMNESFVCNSSNLDKRSPTKESTELLSHHSDPENSDSERIVTKVHVHTLFYHQKNSSLSTELKDASFGVQCHTVQSSSEKSENICIDKSEVPTLLNSANRSDWPDLNDIARPINVEDIVIQENSVNSSSDPETVFSNPSNLISENSKELVTEQVVIIDEKEENPETTDSKSTYYKKTKQSSKTYEHTNGTSSTRTLKSILSNNGSEPPEGSPSVEHLRERSKSETEIQECKSVKFSKDTVFNENKSKKYKFDKIEKINLREIYRGKISSDSAMAKMNPLFHDDMEVDGEDREQGSLTDDEKLAYQIALKNMMNSTKSKGNSSPKTSTYMDHYLILKAHGLKSSNFDIEKLPEEIEKPAYDRLIQRTIAKERRKLIVKWSLVLLTVAIVTAVATYLGVTFTNSD